MSPPSQSSRTQKIGVLAILLSVLCFYLGSLPIRWAHAYGTLGGAEFIFTRFLLGSFLVCGYAIAQGYFPRPDRPRILIARVIFHFLAGWLYYWCIELSTAALGNILHMTYPLFAAVILFVAGKSATPWRDLILGIVCVIGIAMTSTHAGSTMALVIGTLSGICGGFSVILLTTTRAKNSTIDVFFYTFIGSLFLCFFVAQPVFSINRSEELYLLGAAALLGVAGQFFFTYGAAYLTAVDSSVLSCLRIPLALFGGLIGLEQSSPTLLAAFGALIIFAANIVVVRNSRIQARIASDRIP